MVRSHISRRQLVPLQFKACFYGKKILNSLRENSE